MTQTDFIAACFWPTMIAMVFLVRATRDPAGVRWTGHVAFWVAVSYFILLTVLNSYSLVALVDLYVLSIVAGCLMLWICLRAVSGRATHLTTRKLFYATLLSGAGLAGFGIYTLFGDFVLRPLELEGRVERVWTRGSRNQTYYARIAGQTVKAVIPDYERLSLLPVVRVEVGRGSNYIYRIEYLAN